MRTSNGIALAVAGALLAACTTPSSTSPSSYDAGPTASAKLEPTKGNNASGTVSFTQRGDKVFVTANVRGLKPNAEHGFHIHEKGDCGSGDGMSAGGHYNPAAKSHGDYRQGGERHAGDLPNLKADGEGNASARFETSGVTIGGGAADIVGRGLIVHRDPDDYKSQPAGNAGPRLACAVIQRG